MNSEHTRYLVVDVDRSSQRDLSRHNHSQHVRHEPSNPSMQSISIDTKDKKQKTKISTNRVALFDRFNCLWLCPQNYHKNRNTDISKVRWVFIESTDADYFCSKIINFLNDKVGKVDKVDQVQQVDQVGDHLGLQALQVDQARQEQEQEQNQNQIKILEKKKEFLRDLITRQELEQTVTSHHLSFLNPKQKKGKRRASTSSKFASKIAKIAPGVASTPGVLSVPSVPPSIPSVSSNLDLVSSLDILDLKNIWHRHYEKSQWIGHYSHFLFPVAHAHAHAQPPCTTCRAYKVTEKALAETLAQIDKIFVCLLTNLYNQFLSEYQCLQQKAQREISRIVHLAKEMTVMLAPHNISNINMSLTLTPSTVGVATSSTSATSASTSPADTDIPMLMSASVPVPIINMDIDIDSTIALKQLEAVKRGITDIQSRLATKISNSSLLDLSVSSTILRVIPNSDDEEDEDEGDEMSASVASVSVASAGNTSTNDDASNDTSADHKDRGSVDRGSVIDSELQEIQKQLELDFQNLCIGATRATSTTGTTGATKSNKIESHHKTRKIQKPHEEQEISESKTIPVAEKVNSSPDLLVDLLVATPKLSSELTFEATLELSSDSLIFTDNSLKHVLELPKIQHHRDFLDNLVTLVQTE